MGIFNGILDKFRKKETKPPIGIFSTDSIDGKSEISMYDIAKEREITHSDGRRTDLILAKITKHIKDETIFDDRSNYIAFELQHGQQLTQRMAEIIMDVYDRQYQQKKVSYLGTLEEDARGIQIGKKSMAVEQTVEKIVIEMEEERQEQSKKYYAMQQQKEASYREALAQRTKLAMEEQRLRQEERRQNPFIKCIGSEQREGKKYYSYDGINIETGEILRIRSVNKVGKDGSGTYLYTAYLSSTLHEYDEEFEEDMSIPICFTLGKRLSDIVQQGDRQEIQTLLCLLSNNRNFEYSDQLNYIGEMDRFGNITNGQYAFSAIGMKIQELQRDYINRIEDRRKQKAKGE